MGLVIRGLTQSGLLNHVATHFTPTAISRLFFNQFSLVSTGSTTYKQIVDPSNAQKISSIECRIAEESIYFMLESITRNPTCFGSPSTWYQIPFYIGESCIQHLAFEMRSLYLKKSVVYKTKTFLKCRCAIYSNLPPDMCPSVH